MIGIQNALDSALTDLQDRNANCFDSTQRMQVCPFTMGFFFFSNTPYKRDILNYFDVVLPSLFSISLCVSHNLQAIVEVTDMFHSTVKAALDFDFNNVSPKEKPDKKFDGVSFAL